VKRRAFISGIGAAAVASRVTPAWADLYSDVKIGLSTPANFQDNGVFVWIKTCSDLLQQAGFGVRIYPNSTIGGEHERISQMQLGLLDINATGGDEIARWSPMAAAGARPFLVNSYDHMSRLIADTPYIEAISADLRKQGLELIDFAYTASMVGLFTHNTPVHNLADLQKLRLRVLSEADFSLLRAWQVRGVKVAWEEVAQALQTGIVDAYLNPPNIATMFGHGTVLDYFSDLRMGPASRLLVASTRWLDSLTSIQRDELQGIFLQARAANRDWARDREALDRQRLEKTGIEWISLTEENRNGWVEASKAIPPSAWDTPEATGQYLEWVEATRRAGE
jgi:TRAP-type C4-dicarboxylate transport system substrate-binding protein